MKNMFENAKTFAAFANIDYCYYLIENEYEQIEQERAKLNSPIAVMIWNATNFAEEKEKEHTKTLKSLLRTVIKNKKIVEADYSGDQEFLDKLNNTTKATRKQKKQK